MKSTMIMVVAVLAFGAFFLPSVQATAEAEVIVRGTCHGIIGAGIGQGTCQSSGCSGAVTVAVGIENCHGDGTGCDASVASLDVGNNNCQDGRGGKGGDVGDGSSGGSGGEDGDDGDGGDDGGVG